MKIDISNRFDMVMANIKPVEPSPNLDIQFKRRLDEAAVVMREETLLNKVARRGLYELESLRVALVPQAFAMAKYAVTFLFIFSIGLYVYSVQPSSPAMSSLEGDTLIKSAAGPYWEKADISRKVRAGDTFITKEGSQLDITLSNRYTIRLKDKTKFRVAKLTPRYGKGEALFELIEGRALVNIDNGFKPSRFLINTKSATTTALGTKFAVDASEKDTSVSVLEGKVKVKSRYVYDRLLMAKGTVLVGAGQKTEVAIGHVPLSPQRLIDKEWQGLEELYQIGRKPRVLLLIKNTPDRAKQLLRPCPIYISDEKPREIPKVLEDIIIKIAEAVKTKDKMKHIESIGMLERMIEKHPNPKYDVQFLLYIGAYYEYVGYQKEAISALEKVLKEYPDSPFASIAQCAIGIIYEEKLGNMEEANKAYEEVMKNYSHSLEAIWVEEKLGVKKVI